MSATGTLRRCADCGVEEIRMPNGDTNISPFGYCVVCHIKRSKPKTFDHKSAQAGERDE